MRTESGSPRIGIPAGLTINEGKIMKFRIVAHSLGALLFLTILVSAPAAFADDRDCAKEIEKTSEAAAQSTDAATKSKAEGYLQKAREELEQEQDEAECLEKVDSARALLGI